MISSDLTVYLAGKCRGLEDEGTSWRNEIAVKLQTVAEWINSDIQVIDPTKYFSYSENKHKSNKQVKEFFLDKISQCDLVIVNLDDSDSSVGTAQECQFAVDNRIPIVGFGTKNMYEWIAEVDCQVVFDSMHEVVDYVRDYYLT